MDRMLFFGNKNFLHHRYFPLSTTTIKGVAYNNGSDVLTFKENRTSITEGDSVYYFLMISYYQRGWSILPKKNFTVGIALNGTIHITRQSY